MVVTLRIPSLRALALVFAGAIAGVTLVAPVVARDASPTAVEPSAMQTRAVSCSGYNFMPLEDGIAYDYAAARRTSGGSQYFVCDPQLPHRAVVTKVRFTLYDATPYGEVRDCALVRSHLSALRAHTVQTLASVPSTGIDAPGAVRLVDTTIDFATVDNTKYAYWLQCYIYAAGAWYEGIYGADVTYTIDSQNG